MSLTTELREKLASTTVTMERFREIAIRLLSYGVLVRDEDRTEQALYDETRQIESLMSEYFEVVGMYMGVSSSPSGVPALVASWKPLRTSFARRSSPIG